MEFVNLGAQFNTYPFDVASSYSGSVVYVTDLSNNALYKSTDYGVNFSVIYSGFDGGVRGCACTSDGLTVYVSDITNATLYRSTDGGGSFSGVIGEFLGNPTRVCCSGDGAIVYVCESDDRQVYKSTDYGVNFAATGFFIPAAFGGICCSYDGSQVYVSDSSQKTIFKSIDYAVSFFDLSLVGDIGGGPKGISCSPDGQLIFIVDDNGDDLYSSTDGGATFFDTNSDVGNSPGNVSISGDAALVYLIDGSSDSLLRAGEVVIKTSKLTPELIKEIEAGDLLNAKAGDIITTGDLLPPESVVDIATGDLLASESKAGIATGDVLTAQSLPDNENLPFNYARIGYDNMLKTGTSLSDNLGAAKMLTPSTYDKWRPAVGAMARLEGDLQSCNYVGVAAHNIGSQGGRIVVEVSNAGNDSYSISTIPNNDNALFLAVPKRDYNRVEITVYDCVAPEIGVVYMGESLVMMRPIFAGHSPSVLSATDVTTPQMSDGGQFLGKQIVRQGYATSAEFKHLTDEWYRDKFQPFVVHAKTRPYFWAWNLLESPDDVVYGWTNGNIKPTYMGIRNWLEVSFSIEAHV